MSSTSLIADLFGPLAVQFIQGHRIIIHRMPALIFIACWMFCSGLIGPCASASTLHAPGASCVLSVMTPYEGEIIKLMELQDEVLPELEGLVPSTATVRRLGSEGAGTVYRAKFQVEGTAQEKTFKLIQHPRGSFGRCATDE